MKRYHLYSLVFFLVLCAYFVLSPKHTALFPILTPANHDSYTDAFSSLFPTASFEHAPRSSSVSSFNDGRTAVVYDTVGVQLSRTNTDYMFTGQFVETVIIAVDRDIVSDEITSFFDILNSNHSILFDFDTHLTEDAYDYPTTHHIVLSMAYALYDDYDVDAIAKDLRALNEQGRLLTRGEDAPIIITHDTAAVDMINHGRNLEIIVPSDGTLSFYVGLLHDKDAVIATDLLIPELSDNGYRTNMYANEAYPPARDYESAVSIDDYGAYNAAAVKVSDMLSRQVFTTSSYGYTNSKQLAVFYLVLVFILIAYIITIILRVTQKKTRNAIIYVCTLQILFITLGFFKDLSENNPLLETIFWYGYYIPILMVPAIFLYIANNVGYAANKKVINIFYRIYIAITVLVLALVLTNGLHGIVFSIHDPDHVLFTYNTAYYFVIGWAYVSVFFAVGALIKKSFRSPRKRLFLLPLASTIIVFTYTVMYVLDVQFVHEMSVSYSLTLLTFLYTEACMRSRLFPINMGYDKLFASSHLSMEIADHSGMVVARSAVIRSESDDFVLRKNPIAGGSFSYYEDYSSLNKTREKLAIINSQLEKNNALLVQQGKVNADLSALRAEKSAYENIDAVLERGTERIGAFLDEMKISKDVNRIIGRINILACTMKRECMLLISLLYRKSQPMTEFLNVLLEMKEFTSPFGLTITVGTMFSGDLPFAHTLPMYRMFSSAIDRAAQLHCKNVLVQLYESDRELVFSVLADQVLFDEGELSIYKNKKAYSFNAKPWDDTQSLLLSFPRKEEGDA